MTDKCLDGTAEEVRRTLSDADISSRRNPPRRPLAGSLGASGASASASVRGSAPRREHDGAPLPAKGDAGDRAAKPGQDRD